MSDIIEVIFPEQMLHLVAGPTGAGKSRWLLETLLNWQDGRNVYGYRSHPCKWLYVSGDRQELEARKTIESLGINPKRVPIFSAFGVMPPIGALGILDEAEKREANLIVWEGFGQYVESNSGGSGVKRWLNMIVWRMSHKLDGSKRAAPLTIIGVMEQPKMNQKNQYANPRQRISGPAAWGHTANTIVLVEHADKSCKGPLRSLDIYPHAGGAEMHFKATLEDGHFRLLDQEL